MADGTVAGVERPEKLTETVIMLVVLGLIDVVMISNLLIMVIVGGYETFVSRLNLRGHPDEPAAQSGRLDLVVPDVAGRRVHGVGVRVGEHRRPRRALDRFHRPPVANRADGPLHSPRQPRVG